jgi:hypothetical protein
VAWNRTILALSTVTEVPQNPAKKVLLALSTVQLSRSSRDSSTYFTVFMNVRGEHEPSSPAMKCFSTTLGAYTHSGRKVSLALLSQRQKINGSRY